MLLRQGIWILELHWVRSPHTFAKGLRKCIWEVHIGKKGLGKGLGDIDIHEKGLGKGLGDIHIP
jgi:hypothetical protein